LFWHSRSSRTALIVVLLLISLGAASMLAVQAYYLETSQRAAAEGVLSDYSALIADEVIRRSTAEIGYSGYYLLIEALRRDLQQLPGLSTPPLTALATSSDARLQRASKLAAGYFQMERPPARLTFFGFEPGEDAAEWLRQNLASPKRTDPGLLVLNAQIQGVSRTFVALSVHRPGQGEKIAGFEVNLAALNPWFESALNRQSLIPASLGHGRVSNSFVYVSIRDQGGVERFRMGQEQSHRPAVKQFGDAYQGMFSGFSVQASLDPQVAGRIIIGGLPRSRLPFLLGLLILNAGLVVTAILQLRRESALQQLRDEFVSSVSHELRTPLTQIRMFAETLLLERIRSDEERRRSLEIIDREARRLTQLVENLLQFSRMERKKDPLARVPHALAVSIQEIVDDFSSVTPIEQSRFKCELRSQVEAEVDPGAFRQIVINLLDNAVKYGKKPQVVIVGLESRAGKASLFIDDEGPGVPPADRKRVFESFHRLERDRRSVTAGTGIGLSVVQDLVARHGGRCWVTTGDRGGAKFLVELPLCSGNGVKDSPENLP